VDRWIVAVGVGVVIVSGLVYLVAARPGNRSSDIPEGDAIEMADRLRAIRAGR
jgi:hypothetical protein